MSSTIQAESRAQDVLASMELDVLPVDPVAVARKENISVKNAKFYRSDISGMIAKRDDGVFILVNADEPPYRKRFTIAHELGHYFLHLSENGEFIDSSVDLFRDTSSPFDPARNKEAEANSFAASLLMPREKVSALYKELKSVSQLARTFNVSEEAMAIRIARLGLSSESIR
jgi:Zn-dependent peptidase ImmA (M78 family)